MPWLMCAAMDRVVVADDNPSMTMALRMVLEMWGWDVVVAHDGVTAVAAIRKTRPAVALIDIGLPGMDGLEVARMIRAASAVPPLLVALSGFGDEQDRRRSHEAGFDKHLVKPVEPDLLRATITSTSNLDRGRTDRDDWGRAPIIAVRQSPI
jgi:DNA-binding response OmpR family regulator